MLSDPRYLLRFDDLCPTMNWRVWAEIESLLDSRQLKPLVAVVPDNLDPGLMVDSPVEDFWDRVRGWQDRGWTIALHGFQHTYVSWHAGLVASRKLSEFAGLPREEQREKLRRAVEIFAREGIHDRVWIAPGDTFDAVTVSLLPEFGVRIINAGYFRRPFVCPQGITWVPQQLYHFRPAPKGVWTVCSHPHQWNASRLQQFKEEVNRYASHVVSLQDILDETLSTGHKWSAWLCTKPRLSRFLVRLELKLWSWWSPESRGGQLAALNGGRSEQSSG